MTELIISHANCMDGLAAAWVAKQAYPTADVKYMNYSDLPPDVSGYALVLITDFSFGQEYLIGLCNKNSRVVLCDHHKTAAEVLAPGPWVPGNLAITFDLTKSGAQLTEQLLGFAPSKVVAYVGDRDLWKFELPNSREINALLGSKEFSFCWLDTVEHMLQESPTTAILMGTVIYDYQLTQAKKGAERFICKTDVEHRTYGVANLTSLISETANAALSSGKYHYVASYFDRLDTHQRIYSLRSQGEIDVSAIAKKFGGGGHKNAAGFTLGVGSFDPLSA